VLTLLFVSPSELVSLILKLSVHQRTWSKHIVQNLQGRSALAYNDEFKASRMSQLWCAFMLRAPFLLVSEDADLSFKLKDAL